MRLSHQGGMKAADFRDKHENPNKFQQAGEMRRAFSCRPDFHSRLVCLLGFDWMKLPFFKFFPGDWLKDPSLKRCSHAAKGVLMDVLCMVFEAEERGVCISGASPWSEKEIAEAVGGNADVVVRSISELIQKGVLKKRADGAIYSARMVRDEELRVKRGSGGRFGGNPSLCKVNLINNHPPNLISEYESEPESCSVPSGKGECEGKTDLQIPMALRSKPFGEVWAAWTDYRMKRGRCVDFLAMFQKQLDWLGEFPEEIAIKMLNQSMRNNWQGIFEIRPTVNGYAGAPHTPRPLGVNELRSIMQAKENNAQDIRKKYCSEVAMGETWSDHTKRQEYFAIKKEIKKINNQISSYA